MENICRICLQAGAELPIFQAGEETIKIKIYACLRDEIKDIKGYPRNICMMCNTTLDAMYKLIETYKRNIQWLEDTGNLKFKLESDNIIYIEQDLLSVASETDVPLAKIKVERDLDFSDFKTEIDSSEDQPLIKIKEEKYEEGRTEKKEKNYSKSLPLAKKENKIKRKTKIGKKIVKKTNNIATSLLEGEFFWSDMKWSYTKQTPPKQMPASKKAKVIEKNEKTAKKVKSHSESLCDLCGTVFGDQYKLNAHIKTRHDAVSLKCDEPGCTKIFNKERNLLGHKARKHSTKRDYMCAVCSKSFAMLRDVTTHMRLHKENYIRKRYSCSICDKTFSAKKCVEIHERSAHTGDRPAVCSVCDSAFFHDDYLKEHMRLHTGETPFHCPVCGRGYAQRGNMKSHLKQHHVSELNSEIRARMRPNYLKLLKC